MKEYFWRLTDIWIVAIVFGVYMISILLDAFGISLFDGWMSVLVAFFAILLGLMRPFSALLLMGGVIGIETIRIVPESFVFTLRLYQVLLFSAFLGMGVRWFWSKSADKQKFFRLTTADIGVVLIGVGGFFSAIFSEYTTQSIRLSLIVSFFVLLYFTIRFLIKTVDEARRFFVVFFVGAMASSIVAIVQNLSFLRGWGIWTEVMPGRPNGFFAEAEWLGLFLAVSLVSLWGLFILRHREQFSKTATIVFGGLSTVSVMALIITVSRSAWLAFFVGVLILFALAFYYFGIFAIKRLYVPIISFGIALAFTIAIPLTNFELFNRAQSSVSGLQEITISCYREIPLPDRIGRVAELKQYGCRHIDVEEIAREQEAGYFVSRILRDDPNANERKRVWYISASTIVEHPLVGVGWGGIPSLLGADPRGTNLNASNLFLEIWLGTGVLGGIGVILIFFWLIANSIRLIVLKNKEGFLVGSLVFSTFCVMGVFNFFNASMLLGVFWLWLGISVSMLEYARRERNE